MALGPVAGLLELPRINNIAVENQTVATDIFKKMIYLSDLAVVRAEVNVGNYDRFEFEWFEIHLPARLANLQVAG